MTSLRLAFNREFFLNPASVFAGLFFIPSLILIPNAGAAVWTVTGSMSTARDGHTATLLPDGKVLVAGGEGAGYLSSAELYSPASGGFSATGAMTKARYMHTATLLPDGKVLMAGGYSTGPDYYPVEAELYDPLTGDFLNTGALVEGREDHTATLLSNGKVLIAGGYNSGALATAEIYDPAAGTFSATGSMAEARRFHKATLLPDGKVLVTGGYNGSGTLSTAEVYDPGAGTFSAAGPMGVPRYGHTSTMLSNGKVLITGGKESSPAYSSAELYDPAAGTFSPTGAMTAARELHTATLLPDGKVLIAAGRDASYTTSAEIYDPADGTFVSTGTVAGGARAAHTAILLPNGGVLLIGGLNGGVAVSGAALYTPSVGPFSATGSMSSRRFYHSSTLLPNGKVLVAGGGNGTTQLLTAELYDPALGTWSATGSMSAIKFRHTATLLPNGKVLVVGGDRGTNGTAIATAQLYDPDAGTWAATGSLPAGRSEHSATLLANGKVLVSGGVDTSVTALSSCQLYDPGTGTWAATGSMNISRRDNSVTLLPNGKVLAAGGLSVGAQKSAELYDPNTGTWSYTGSMGTARRSHTATLLPNGKVMVAGGLGDSFPVLASAEMYDPGTGLWSSAGTMAAGRMEHSAIVLPNGAVLVAGMGTAAELYNPVSGLWSSAGALTAFRNENSAALLPNGKVLLAGGSDATAEIASYTEYDYKSPLVSAFQPSILSVNGGSSFPVVISSGAAITIAGSAFSGLSQGTGENFPRVYLQAADSGNFGGTSNTGARFIDVSTSVSESMWSGTSLTFAVPDGVPAGYYLLRVQSDARPSDAKLLRVVARETIPPTVAVSTPSDASVVDSLTVISGTAADNEFLSGVKVSMKQEDSSLYWTGSAFSSVDPVWLDCTVFPSSWTYDASLAGLVYGSSYSIEAVAQDFSGNWSVPNARSTFYYYDPSPPSAVTDLTLQSLSTFSAQISWSAPGDDGMSGILNNSIFTIQYATYTSVHWSTSAAQINISTSNVTPGSGQYLALGGLSDNTSYFFRLWTKDDAGNFSPLSNGATVATLMGAPADIYFDEISSISVVASAYAPTPAFSNLNLGQSGTNVAINTNTWTWAGWHGEKWTNKAPMPTLRNSLAAVVIGKKLYAVGGKNGGTLNVNEEYDPVADTWVTKAGMPTARYSLMAGVIGEKLYAVGGKDAGYLAVNEEYDPVSNTWSSKAPMPAPRSSLSGGVAGGKLYAVSGNDTVSTGLRSNEAYDPLSNTWAAKAQIPTGRGGLSAGTVDGKFYALGGWDWGYKDKNEAYDPATNAWTTKAAMPATTSGLATGSVGGKIYSMSWGKLYEYSATPNVWASRISPLYRGVAAAGVIDGKIYFVGGWDGTTYYNATEEYDPGVAGVFGGLTPNTQYSFKAKARNQAGVETGETVAVSTYTLAVPPAAVAAAALSSTSISVAWSRGADPVDTNFEVQYSSVDAFVSAYAVNTAPLTTNELGSFGGLSPLTTYYFRVRAVNGAGIPTEFIAADPVSTLPVPPVRPAAPSASAVGVSSITWSWAALSGVSGYRIYPATAPASVIASTGDAAYTRSGLSPNATYSIMVAGVNASGEGSASPAALTVFTLANPPAGTAVGAVYVTSAAITWGLNGNPAATSAEVSRSTDNAHYANVFFNQAASFTDTGLSACATYYYKVRNFNGDGIATGFGSMVQLLTGDFIPPPPSALAAEPVAGGKLALTWEFSPGGEAAAEYRLYSDNGTGTIDYAAPYAVFSSTVSAWLTGALTPGSLYKFGLRAVNRCGVEEENTSVFASATAAASLSGARAVIKVPQTGKRIRGNRVTVAAELTLGTPAQTRQVRFQYRPLGGGAWTDIAAADVNHPNPDLEAPYFVHWDVDSLGIVSAATYELRAQAADLAGTDDQEPPTITVVLDPLDYDIRETLAAGEITKEQKISNTVSTTVQAADDGTALVAKVTIPAGAVDASTVTVSVVNNPSLKPAALSGSDDLNLSVQIGLSNAQSRLSGGNLSTVVLSYNDADGDGVLDGSSVRADQLKMYSAHALADAWEPLPSVFDKVKKTVSGTTSHFSFFALFVPLAASLDAVRVYPVPFVPDDGKADNGVPYSASDPDSGIVFDGLTAAVKIRIYTLSGQLVADFGSASSSGKLQWDGRNEDGKNAASGGYLAVISSPGHKAVVKKLLIIR